MTKGARARYLDEAKALSKELQGRERAAYMVEVLRGLSDAGSEADCVPAGSLNPDLLLRG